MSFKIAILLGLFAFVATASVQGMENGSSMNIETSNLVESTNVQGTENEASMMEFQKNSAGMKTYEQVQGDEQIDVSGQEIKPIQGVEMPHFEKETSIAGSELGVASRSCVVKYTTKWPHCTNIRCFGTTSRTVIENECANNPACDGFSYTGGNPGAGSGCLKQKCRPDGVNRYGYGSHMYFECSVCKVKYTDRWPHCTNIRCFGTTSRAAIENECANNPACDGFSYTRGDPFQGTGCLKQKCRPDNVNRYGHGSHMYFQCKPEQRAGVCKVKYSEKWPHCTNISCFRPTPGMEIEGKCAKDAKCNGFSYTANNPPHGIGCLKQKCEPDNVHGYGYGSHMYFKCESVCKVKYTDKWPHCTNIRCFATTSRMAIENECAKNPACDGFSYTGGNPFAGSGCLKQKCRPDNVHGYGHGSHMYFQCKPDEKPQPRMCIVKYTDKWPHCTNISCFGTTLRTTLENECANNPACDGFSYTRGNPSAGGGCFKQRCQPDNVNRYGHGSHMYFECGANLAFGKQTWQSSTGWGGVSGRAVDGNTNGHWGAGSCTHTGLQGNPNWTVDLEKIYKISSIRLYNRVDCCSERLQNIQIWVSENNRDWHLVAKRDGHNSGKQFVDINIENSSVPGRYVRVQLGAKTILTLCEVQIFGKEVPTSIFDTRFVAVGSLIGVGASILLAIAVGRFRRQRKMVVEYEAIME